MDLVVQRVNQQELYIPYLQTFQVLQVSSSQVYCSRQLDPRTVSTNFIPPRSLTSPSLRQVHLQDATIKPKEVSLDSPHKEDTPNIELPNNENKLFDVDDDVGTSTIPDLSVPSEDEEEVKFNDVWEHAIDILFKLSPLHPDGKSLRKWAKHQNMDDMGQFYQWDEKC